jgi:23S rRNA pseudouridine1911/1915/1917 synthase
LIGLGGERPLDVLYVDNHVLAVCKPAGLPIVPDSSGDQSLLEQARTWVGREFTKPGRVFLGVVHRLDRPVSGVVVFGRTSKGAARLSKAFAERGTTKVYWGVVAEPPRGETGRLVQHLWKDSERNRVHIVGADQDGAKEACTNWRLLEGRGGILLELIPETGRSHQLRVACASLGSPLLGDLRYGAERPLEDRSIALHARSLTIPHPTRDVDLVISTPPPDLDVWSFDAARKARQQGSRADEVER